MHRTATSTFIWSALAALTASAAIAGSASAAPAWKLNGATLEGTEEVFAAPPANNVAAIPGLTLQCLGSLAMNISNSSGTGAGEVVELPLESCVPSDETCTIEAAEAVSLPWSVKATTVSKAHYLVVKGIQFEVLFDGALCVLDEWVLTYLGTAGGLYDNGTETLTFSPATMSATGTGLDVLGEKVEWTGIFPLKVLGPNSGASLTLS